MRMKYLIAILIWCFTTVVWAQTSPVDMLQTTTSQVLSMLNSNRATLKTKPVVVRNIMNQYLLPHIALESMARSVLSRSVWNNATAEQRQQFTQQFKRLLVNTYASALASYTDQAVQYLPLRGDAAGRSHVQVNSKIVRQDGPPISVNYQLVRAGSDDWQVYDFSVDGVSMLGSFRSQFTSELAQHGLDALIKRLAGHNSVSE